MLPFTDAEQVSTFWTSLGFSVTNVGTDEVPYLLVMRNGAELHYFLSPLSRRSGVEEVTCMIAVPDVDELHAEWMVGDLPAEVRSAIRSPRIQVYGLREMQVSDPDGTIIRIATGA